MMLNSNKYTGSFLPESAPSCSSRIARGTKCARDASNDAAHQRSHVVLVAHVGICLAPQTASNQLVAAMYNRMHSCGGAGAPSKEQGHLHKSKKRLIEEIVSSSANMVRKYATHSRTITHAHFSFTIMVVLFTEAKLIRCSLIITEHVHAKFQSC